MEDPCCVPSERIELPSPGFQAGNLAIDLTWQADQGKGVYGTFLWCAGLEARPMRQSCFW